MVRKGEFLLDWGFVEQVQKTTREMNWEKEGRPYRYSDGLIHLAAVAKIAFKQVAVPGSYSDEEFAQIRLHLKDA